MADTPPRGLATTASKRPRPVISCLECRRKKLKCDRTCPCQQCIKIGRPGRCSYQSGQEPEPNAAFLSRPANKRPRRMSSVADNADDAPIEPNFSREQAPTPVRRGVVEDLQARVARLERALLLRDSQQQNGVRTSSQTPSSLQRGNSPVDGVQAPINWSQINSQVSRI